MRYTVDIFTQSALPMLVLREKGVEAQVACIMQENGDYTVHQLLTHSDWREVRETIWAQSDDEGQIRFLCNSLAEFRDLTAKGVGKSDLEFAGWTARMTNKMFMLAQFEMDEFKESPVTADDIQAMKNTEREQAEAALSQKMVNELDELMLLIELDEAIEEQFLPQEHRTEENPNWGLF